MIMLYNVDARRCTCSWLQPLTWQMMCNSCQWSLPTSPTSGQARLTSLIGHFYFTIWRCSRRVWDLWKKAGPNLWCMCFEMHHPTWVALFFPEIMIVVLSFTETCLRRTFEMPKHFLGAFMVLDNIFDGSSYSYNSRIFSMFVIGLQVFLFPVNPGFAMPRVSSVTSSVTQCPAACCLQQQCQFSAFSAASSFSFSCENR